VNGRIFLDSHRSWPPGRISIFVRLFPALHLLSRVTLAVSGLVPFLFGADLPPQKRRPIAYNLLYGNIISCLITVAEKNAFPVRRRRRRRRRRARKPSAIKSRNVLKRENAMEIR